MAIRNAKGAEGSLYLDAIKSLHSLSTCSSLTSYHRRFFLVS